MAYDPKKTLVLDFDDLDNRPGMPKRVGKGKLRYQELVKTAVAFHVVKQTQESLSGESLK